MDFQDFLILIHGKEPKILSSLYGRKICPDAWPQSARHGAQYTSLHTGSQEPAAGTHLGRLHLIGNITFVHQTELFVVYFQNGIVRQDNVRYQAKLLILDEPTSGLDAVVRNDLLDEMREYMKQDGRAILISSHISSDLEGLCDDLYFIQNGQVLFHEDTDVIQE